MELEGSLHSAPITARRHRETGGARGIWFVGALALSIFAMNSHASFAVLQTAVSTSLNTGWQASLRDWVVPHSRLFTSIAAFVFALAAQVAAARQFKRIGWWRVALCYAAVAIGFDLAAINFFREWLYHAIVVEVTTFASLAFFASLNWDEILDWLSPHDGTKRGKRPFIEGFAVFVACLALAIGVDCVSAKYFPTWWNLLLLVDAASLAYFILFLIVRRFPIVGDIIVGFCVVVLIAIAVLKYDHSLVLPAFISSWISAAETSAGALLNAMQAPLAASTIAVLTTRAAAILGQMRRQTTPEEDAERRRLAAPVRVHDNLASLKWKLLLLGTTVVGDVTPTRETRLFEIWLYPEEPRYNFDQEELTERITQYAPIDEEGYLVVTKGRNRAFVAYSTLEDFKELLFGQDQNAAQALIQALGNRNFAEIRRRLSAESVSSSQNNHFAIRAMGAYQLQQILVVDRHERYIGFCNLEDLVHEVFGK